MTNTIDRLTQQAVYRLVEPDAERLEEYLEATKAILGLVFPQPYLERAEICCLVDQQDRLCGGGMVVLEPEFRSLQSIPEFAIDASLGDLETALDVAEINGVWIHPEIKSPMLPLAFWGRFLEKILETGMPRLLFTFNNDNTQMRKLTSWLAHEVLYSGLTRQLDGMPRPTHETVALTNREALQNYRRFYQK